MALESRMQARSSSKVSLGAASVSQLGCFCTVSALFESCRQGKHPVVYRSGMPAGIFSGLHIAGGSASTQGEWQHGVAMLNDTINGGIPIAGLQWKIPKNPIENG